METSLLSKLFQTSPTKQAKRLARKLSKKYKLVVSRDGNTITVGTHPDFPQFGIRYTNKETLIIRSEGDGFNWQNASAVADDSIVLDMIDYYLPSRG